MWRGRKGHVLRALLASLLTAALCLAWGLRTASAGLSTRDVAYLSSSLLTTVNAATDEGYSTDAIKLSARLYPGAFVDGPGGQTLLNSDVFTSVTAQDASGNILGDSSTSNTGASSSASSTTSAAIGLERITSTSLLSKVAAATYTINPKAVYSDGTALSCDDYLLAWVAAKNSALFHSHTPLVAAITSMSCGNADSDGITRTFTIHFPAGTPYIYLFAAGTVMPSHVVANAAGISDLHSVLTTLAENGGEVPSTTASTGRNAQASADAANETLRHAQALATAWQNSFTLDPASAASIVTSGPYVIASMTTSDPLTSGSSVTLSRNARWWGDAAVLDTITVFPRTASVSDLGRAGALKIADIDQAVPMSFDNDDTTTVSSGTSGSSNSANSSNGGAPDSSTGTDGSATSSSNPAGGGATGTDATSTDTNTADGTDTTNPTSTSDSTSNTGGVNLADLLQPSVGPTINGRGQNYAVVTTVSRRINSLVPASTGIMADTAARSAISHCVDRTAVADASGSVAGMSVPGYGLRLTPPTSAAASAVSDVANEYTTRSQQHLDGTVRLGYDSSNARYAAMAQKIIDSCAEMGVTVVDQSTPGMDLGHLGTDVDLFLQAVDPYTEFTFVSGSLDDRRAAEKALWDTMPTIPLAAEPRSLVISTVITNVAASTSAAGVGWNLDRWKLTS